MTITSPSGREYQWDKPTPPTQADIDALVQYDASLPTKKAKGAMERAGEVGGDIAVEAGTSLAGQALGAMTGPGYAVVAPVAGAYGNYLKQQREIDRGERSGLSYGEMLVSGVINLIPGSGAAKTAGTVAKTVGKQAAIGAGIGLAGQAAEQMIDEGRFPSIDDYEKYLQKGASGATVGAGVGAGISIVKALSPAARRLWGNMAGKTQQEVSEKLQSIAESGSETERKAASEVLDEVGNRLGLVRPAGESAEKSAQAFIVQPQSAERSAKSLVGEGAVEAEKATREALQKAAIDRERVYPSRFGSEEAAAMAGSRPGAVAPSSKVVPAAERPTGGFGSQAERIGSETPYSAQSAEESARAFQSAVSAEAPLSAQTFEQAYREGQTQAGAIGLKQRLLAEQEAAVRAGDFGKARNLEDIAKQIEANRLLGPERIPPASVLESTMVKPGGKVSRDMGQVLPTTEDILNEFSVMRGVGTKKKARAMGMEGGSISTGTMAGLGAAAGATAVGASMAKGEPRKPDFIEVELPNGQSVRYNTTEWTDTDKIREDANKKWIETQKLAAADPHLKLKEAWANAQSPEDRMKLMWNWLTGTRGAAIATKMGIQAVGSELGPVGRVASGPISEYAASRIEGVPTTTGRMAQSAIEMLPRGGQGMLANALRFAGAGVTGEAARQAIDENKFLSLKDAAQAASEGGFTALPMRVAERGKAAQLEYGRLKRDIGELRLLKDANDAGFAVDPGAMTPGVKQKALVGLAGGSTQFDQFLSRINGPILEEKFRNVAGVGPNAKLGPEAYAAKRLEAGGAYFEAAKISKAAEAAVDEWKQANSDMARAYSKYANSLSPEDLKAAKTQKARADAAFSTIQSEAYAAGKPQVAKDVQKARAKYAQLFAMEEATDANTGRINNAALLGHMYNDGVPFTDDLAIVAKIAASQPQVLQDTSKIIIRGVGPAPLSPVAPAVQRFLGSQFGQQMSGKSYDLGNPSFAAQLARFGTGAVIDEAQRPIPYR